MSDPDFILLGDALWIDFINTARGHDAAPIDRLPELSAYHRWIKAEKLGVDADELPWEEVLALRTRLLGVASALAEDRQPPSSAIHEINHMLVRATGHHQLTRVGGCWQLAFAPQRAATALEAVAASAAQTLADQSVRVRQCRAEPCSLFFIDRSVDHSRAWCSAEPTAHTVRIDRRRAFQ